MKKFIVFLASLLFLASGLFYVNIKVAQNSIKGATGFIAGSEYIEQWEELVSLTPIMELVPVEYKEAVEGVMDQAVKDPKIQGIIEDQTNGALDDILNGTMSFDQAAMTQDMLDVIDQYADEVEKATDQQVPKEVIKQKFESRITGYNLETQYKKVIVKVQKQLTPQQKELLSMVSQFNQNTALYLYVSLILMAVSLGLIALFSISSLFTVSLFGIFIVLINKLGFNLMGDRVLASMPELNMVLQDQFYTTAIIALALLAAFGLVFKVLKNRHRFTLD